MKTERRSYNVPAACAKLETRADGQPMIVGYAAVYYDPADAGTEFCLYDDGSTRVVERIMPGAFTKAVSEDDVRALFNHDADNLLGRTRSGTLRLSLDQRGVRYEIDPPDTQTARDLLASLKRGDISGSSFAFDIRGEAIRRDGNQYVRELTDVKLYDVGPVTYPAYTGTDSGVRSDGDVSATVERVKGAARDSDLIAVTLAACDADELD